MQSRHVLLTTRLLLSHLDLSVPRPSTQVHATHTRGECGSVHYPPPVPRHRLSLKPRVAGHACDIALNSIILNILHSTPSLSVLD